MSDFYINPAWFYWINTIDNLKIVAGLLIVVGGFIAFILMGHIFDAYNGFDDPDALPIKKKLKALIAIVIFSILILVFVPSKETCIEMMVAQTVTPANVEYAKGEVKDVVDYIFEKVEQTDQGREDE